MDYEASFADRLNAGMAAGAQPPAQTEPQTQQPQGHQADPHAVNTRLEQALNHGMTLWPVPELPREEIYNSLHDLMEAVNDYGERTGCDLIRRSCKTTAKGQPPYRWMMMCARSGRAPDTTPTIRVNTKSKKCMCPFGFWCVAIDRLKPANSQYRIALSDGHHQHNHGPAPIAELANARRRARRRGEPDPGKARKQPASTSQSMPVQRLPADGPVSSTRTPHSPSRGQSQPDRAMEASATRAQPTTAEENMRRMTDAISNRLLSGSLLHSLEQSIARVNGRLDELEGRLARREEAVNSRFDRIIQLLEQQAVRRGR